jgi:CheY-like chemotaxis protein
MSRAALRVLVADDNADVCETTVLVLSAQGYETAAVEHGPDVLAQAQAFQPDVILLDLAMPGMDGFTIARNLLAAFAPKPPALIAVSGYADARTLERCAESGFDLHLAKPVEVEVFELLPMMVGKQTSRWSGAATSDGRLGSSQLKFLDRAVALAMTYLDVATTTGAGELRAKCIERAISAERRVTGWAHQLQLDPTAVRSLMALRIRLRSVC